MKKIITLAIATFAILFSGCAGTAPKIEGGVAVEKTVATYKIAAYSDAEATQGKLKAAGFDIVGTYKSFENGTTILYTNAAMKAAADKPSRALAAVGRILVDDERKQVSIANPIYFCKAYMQDEYNHKVASDVYMALEKAFGPFKNSEDQWDFNGLAGYHFMIGMPYYQDMSVLGEGTTADLVAKAQKAKGTIVQQISADRYLVFVELDKRNSGFVKKIGTQNSEILPWAVMIEGGKARALRAEYNIAIGYPLLTMTEFMGIATMPDAIAKNLEKIFK